MEIVCQVLLLLLLFILQSAAQLVRCSEFRSPLELNNFGTEKNTIEIPRSGKRYKSNQRCEWAIEADIMGHGIELEVVRCMLQGKDFSGNCNNDYVDVIDYYQGKGKLIGRFCGTDKGRTYRSSSNRMTVIFYSDASFEFEGFQAKYWPVPLEDHEKESGKKVLHMAIGIPIGFLALMFMIILGLLVTRCYRRKKAAARSTRATMQNFNPPVWDSLPGGCPPSSLSNTAGIQTDQFSRGLPLPVAFPRSDNECSSNARSVTPPPEYDSLDFSSRRVQMDALLATPPAYDMIVKGPISQ